jgi:phosphatidylinositol glycan class B
MRFIFLCAGLAMIVYTLTAVYSTGYYRPDEHYQIVEFAGLKSGVNVPGDLAWEYSEQIRSAFQPLIAVLVFGVLKQCGITDPYWQVMGLRLLSLVFALSVILYFVKSTLYLVATPYKRAYIFLSLFLWFLPFLNVRFSSESWSGLSFLLALALVQPRETWKPYHFVLAGACLGCSFLFRFQSSILIAGLLCWLWFNTRLNRKMFFLLAVTMIVVILGGMLIDNWFYGAWVCTSLNYFRSNIMEDTASSFGTYPWYFFVFTIVRRPFLPFGLIILVSLVTLIFRRRDNFIVWVVLPFLLIHSYIPHKENRFLFPLINLVPLMIILATQEWTKLGFLKLAFLQRLRPFFLASLVAVNFIFLTAMAFRPAGNSSKSITEYIHRHYKKQPINLLITTASNPYMPYGGLKENFYRDDSVSITNLDWYGLDTTKIIQHQEKNLLVLLSGEYETAKNRSLIDSLHFRMEQQSIPAWIQTLTKFYDPAENKKTYLLFVHE